MSVEVSAVVPHSKYRLWISTHECTVCGSKAIGTNFGVPTCAPCKAFFRRNARRKEVLQMPCQVTDTGDLTNADKDKNNNNNNYCAQIRRCTSCRLRRCFNAGMKEELVRTEEEKQRYKELIELNRQRRREVSKVPEKSQNNLLKISKLIVCNDELLEEKDWTLLSNIVNAYDNYCLKHYTQNRKNLSNDEMKLFDQPFVKINHHGSIRINIISAFLSFLSSMPIIQTLSSCNRLYLAKHNIRALIFPNLHEIEQTCFTDSSELSIDNKAAEYVYGKVLYDDYVGLKSKVGLMLISDPVVTRLWFLVLFFSTPLSCYYDCSLPDISHHNRLHINKIQNSFISLLWNYLLHRHGYSDTIRIYSNFIQIYLHMQRITRAINDQVRTRCDLVEMNQALNRVVNNQQDFC